MAEYIDRMAIPYAKLSEFDKGSLTTRATIESLPTADVVERFKYEMMAERCKTMTKAFIELQKDNKDLHSKLANAIKEITEYRDDEKNDFCEVEVGAINGALEILKKYRRIDYDS